MTVAAIDPEILANPTAVLATNGPDGRPQLTAVWFVVEHDRLCVSIPDSTQKAKNLAADPRCSVLIFHPETPNYCVEIRGTASITSDPEYAFADRLCRRYDADPRSFDPPGTRRLRVAIEPARVVVTDARS